MNQTNYRKQLKATIALILILLAEGAVILLLTFK